jgi:L-Ala-D/L-Glu epimerase
LLRLHSMQALICSGGCNDESIISITAALHMAYACPNTKYIDLDGSFDLMEDLVTGGI